MAHANAKLTFAGRRLVVERIQAGWTQAQVAAAQGVSRSTVSKWWKRFQAEGDAGLRDRSSRPKHTPHALGEQVSEAICRLRRELGCGPHRIAAELGLQASTVYGVLRRAGLNLLARLDRTTRSVIRYERDRRASSSTSTSRSWGVSLTVAASASTRASPRPVPAAGVPAPGVVTTTSTSPSTTTAACLR